MEIERGKVRTREEIMACFKDGQTIAVGGQAGAYMPWDLLDMLEESGVTGFAIRRLIAKPGLQASIEQIVRCLTPLSSSISRRSQGM